MPRCRNRWRSSARRPSLSPERCLSSPERQYPHHPVPRGLFVASARPEGRLFALFALALALRRFWGDWSGLKTYAAVSSAGVTLIFLLMLNSQSGILLYASRIQWVPMHLVAEPGLAEEMPPYRTEARGEWDDYHLHHIRLRKDMFTSEVKVLTEEGIPEHAANQIDGAIEGAGLDIAIRKFWRLPLLATKRVLMGHNEPPAPRFFDYAIRGQLRALYLVNGGKMRWNSAVCCGAFPRQTWRKPDCFERPRHVSVGKSLTLP